MTATNHALTGATIALALHGSWVALPLAFMSHFVLDAIPHYGANKAELRLGSNKFRNLLIIDAACATLLAFGIIVTQPAHWWIVVLSAFAATSPDWMWVMRFVRARRGQKQVPKEKWNWLMRFHAWIQWYEKPRGVVVEAVWFMVMGALFIHLLK